MENQLTGSISPGANYGVHSPPSPAEIEQAKRAMAFVSWSIDYLDPTADDVILLSN